MDEHNTVCECDESLLYVAVKDKNHRIKIDRWVAAYTGLF